MKSLEKHILEKLHLDKNIKVNEKLSFDDWINYFDKNGFTVSKENDTNYSIHFRSKKFPSFSFKTEKLLGKYRCWEPIHGTLKDVPLIEVKEGYEELMDSDELEKTNERLRQYTFTIHNAEIIINTLNYYK